MVRKVNALMVILSGAGGLIGFITGELLLSKLMYNLPDSIVTGLYFGQFALIVGLMCLLAEMISPRLNGANWRRMYSSYSWKFLLPCTFVLLFVTGLLLQSIYGLSLGRLRKINDVAILIDTSGSMKETDPQNRRFQAVKELMDGMTEDIRTSVFTFSDKTVNIQPMEKVTDSLKNDISSKLAAYSVPGGGTNIKAALDEAYSHIKSLSLPDRGAMVILLSDGADSYGLKRNFNETVEPYKSERIPVFTIGMKGSDFFLLNSISGSTGGKYYSVNSAEDVNKVFTRAYRERDNRILMGERSGAAARSILFGLLRVLFMIITGAALGLGIGLVFDNKYIAKSLSLGGMVSGAAAGLILEAGFLAFPGLPYIIRMAAGVAMAAVFTLFGADMEGSREGSFHNRDRNNKGLKHPGPIDSMASSGKRSF